MVLTHLCPTSIIAGGESPYMVRITAMTSLVRVCSGEKTFLKTEIVQQWATSHETASIIEVQPSINS